MRPHCFFFFFCLMPCSSLFSITSPASTPIPVRAHWTSHQSLMFQALPHFLAFENVVLSSWKIDKKSSCSLPLQLLHFPLHRFMWGAKWDCGWPIVNAQKWLLNKRIDINVLIHTSTYISMGEFPYTHEWSEHIIKLGRLKMFLVTWSLKLSFKWHTWEMGHSQLPYPFPTLKFSRIWQSWVTHEAPDCSPSSITKNVKKDENKESKTL